MLQLSDHIICDCGKTHMQTAVNWASVECACGKTCVWEDKKIECMSCGWIGTDRQLESLTSAMEPGCPSCRGTNFEDVENH